VQILLAPAAANYIKLVINTSTVVADPRSVEVRILFAMQNCFVGPVCS
jgi:hypothetical protein